MIQLMGKPTDWYVQTALLSSYRHVPTQMPHSQCHPKLAVSIKMMSSVILQDIHHLQDTDSHHSPLPCLCLLRCNPALLSSKPTVLLCCMQDLDLAQLCSGLPAGTVCYRLKQMVGYVGMHFVCYRQNSQGQWVKADDSRVRLLGSWADVTQDCLSGNIQPCILFYEQ